MTAVSGVASVNATGGGGGGGGGGGPSGNLSPTVTLTSTSTSIAAGGNAMLSATPFDPDGTIAKVEFYDDTTLLATVSSAPYSYTFTSSVVGNHTLGAKVYDNLGATGTSNALIVVVAGGGGGGGGGTNQAPTVTLSSGANAIAAGGTTTLTATATDPDGTISRVEFYDGTTLIGNDTSSPFTFNFSSSVVGSHGLRAIAYDNLNLSTTSATVNVQVNAVAGSSLPRVTLAASTTLVPPNGTVTLTATATAQATGATIATVSFYMDGVKLADDTVTPYTFSATIPAGTHTIYATATDSQGNIKATLIRLVGLPEREVERRALALAGLDAGAGDQLVGALARELAVRRIGLDAEVDVPVGGRVGRVLLDQPLDQRDDLGDRLARERLRVGPAEPEPVGVRAIRGGHPVGELLRRHALLARAAV